MCRRGSQNLCTQSRTRTLDILLDTRAVWQLLIFFLRRGLNSLLWQFSKHELINVDGRLVSAVVSHQCGPGSILAGDFHFVHFPVCSFVPLGIYVAMCLITLTPSVTALVFLMNYFEHAQVANVDRLRSGWNGLFSFFLNFELLNSLSKVTEMNIRWQKYNVQREEAVAKLLHEIQLLQKRVEEAENSGGNLAHETQVEMNRILDESRKVHKELEDQKRQVTRLGGERDRVRYSI